jgi:hypothetical protein
MTRLILRARQGNTTNLSIGGSPIGMVKVDSYSENEVRITYTNQWGKFGRKNYVISKEQGAYPLKDFHPECRDYTLEILLSRNQHFVEEQKATLVYIASPEIIILRKNAKKRR